jgi:DNA-directed RNA polymerase subunit RPC12/RpoP
MFEMLGLGAFLPVVGSVQEGRQRLVEGVPGNQAEASPSREELELPVGDTQRGVDFDAALRGLSEGREPSLDDVGAAPTPAAGEGDDLLVAEPDEAAERPTHAESDEPSGPPPARFPVIQVCAYCSANLEIESPGRYRCPRCHAFLLVQNDGKVEYLESQVPRPVRMELVSSKECTRGLMDFLAAVAKPLLTDPSDLAKLQRAVSSVCRHVRETAYEGNGGRTYEALIAVEKDQIVVEFADSGTRVEPAAVMAEIRPLVDTAEVKGRLGGGNFYKLVKRPRPVETKP